MTRLFCPHEEKGRGMVVAGCEQWGGAPALALFPQSWQSCREKDLK